MCIMRGAAAYQLLSIVVLVATSRAQDENIVSTPDSMKNNALGTKMMELIALTNELETRAQKEGDDVAGTSEKLTNLQAELAGVELLLTQKEDEKSVLSDKICQFSDEVNKIKEDYDALLSWTESLARDD
mmetsp:Transcript_14447/g.28503  ORF Transcript_14447/g.28503 Transcript_14447/m.28503 type:complete len:130 (+) Transcript_14447:59-448(+)